MNTVQHSSPSTGDAIQQQVVRQNSSNSVDILAAGLIVGSRFQRSELDLSERHFRKVDPNNSESLEAVRSLALELLNSAEAGDLCGILKSLEALETSEALAGREAIRKQACESLIQQSKYEEALEVVEKINLNSSNGSRHFTEIVLNLISDENQGVIQALFNAKKRDLMHLDWNHSKSIIINLFEKDFDEIAWCFINNLAKEQSNYIATSEVLFELRKDKEVLEVVKRIRLRSDGAPEHFTKVFLGFISDENQDMVQALFNDKKRDLKHLNWSRSWSIITKLFEKGFDKIAQEFMEATSFFTRFKTQIIEVGLRAPANQVDGKKLAFSEVLFKFNLKDLKTVIIDQINRDRMDTAMELINGVSLKVVWDEGAVDNILEAFLKLDRLDEAMRCGEIWGNSDRWWVRSRAYIVISSILFEEGKYEEALEVAKKINFGNRTIYSRRFTQFVLKLILRGEKKMIQDLFDAKKGELKDLDQNYSIHIISALSKKGFDDIAEKFRNAIRSDK